MSGAGSLVTHLHGVVGTRQVAVRYVVNKEGRIVPTVSQERVRSWVTSLSTPEERAPVNAINDVDSAGTVLQLARPGKAGRKAGNIEPATTALVQGLGQGRSVSQQISWNEVPHSTENRVVPNGPERFAYQAKAGEKWVDVNLTDSTLTAYEGQKVRLRADSHQPRRRRARDRHRHLQDLPALPGAGHGLHPRVALLRTRGPVGELLARQLRPPRRPLGQGVRYRHG